MKPSHYGVSTIPQSCSIFEDQRGTESGSKAEIPRINNFDLLRLLLATSVLLLHSSGLSQNRQLQPLAMIANLSMTHASLMNGAIAVQCFFAVSGFLIFMSYDRTPRLMTYLLKRASRIYPAYAVVIVLTAVFGGFVTTAPLGVYVHSAARYVGANLCFCTSLYPQLAGVFQSNHYPVVNGALWTIKVEVMFYLIVPALFFVLSRAPKVPLIVAIYVCSIAYKAWFEHHGHDGLSNQLPGQMCFFISGGLIYFFYDRFKALPRWSVVLAGAIALFEHTIRWEVLLPLTLAITVIYIATIVPPLVTLKWDLSYGIYIIHFPVLQFLVSRGLLVVHPLGGLLLASLLVFSIASCSWIFIEQPFLKRRLTW